MHPPQPLLAIVIPCYNEEEAIRHTATELEHLLAELIAHEKISTGSYILFVDDGSKDQTWSIIESLHLANPEFRGLKLSRNFGHQAALLAGLHHVADADCAVSMDADLQHDPGAIAAMLAAYARGAEVVYGVRQQRRGDGFMKQKTGNGFYKVMKSLGVETVYNHADFRMMGRKALDAFLELREANLYLRGMVPLVGFQSEVVSFEQHERVAGKSKYNFRKMLSFAWSGISSMSTRPLRFVTTAGFIVFVLSLAMSLYALVVWMLGRTAPGWASTVIAMYFLGGIQLLCIGLIGEYVGKIYTEVKGRPRFIVEKEIKR